MAAQWENLSRRLEELRVGVNSLVTEVLRQREELRLVRVQSEVAQTHQVQAIVELHQTVDELHQQIKAVTPPAPSQAAQSTQNPPTKEVTIAIVALAALLLVIFIVSTIFGFVRSSSWFLGSISALVALILLAILVAYIYNLKWTGLREQEGPPGSKDIFYQGPKTVWDWIQIVIIPVVLLYIAGSIAYTQMTISNDAFNMQHAADVQMAQDQLSESELSSYLSSMSGLLLQATVGNNGQVNADIRIRSLARAQTLTILQELHNNAKQDPDRKARVLKFLYDSGLINRTPFPIVSLADADLRNAALDNAHLSGANLARADLSNAHLNGADLTGAYLSQVKLVHADLTGAKLDFAQITGDSTYVADLSNANFYQADLSGADLTGATLSNANFTQADITGTTLPTNAGYSGVPLPTSQWKVFQTDNTVVIAYNDKQHNVLPAYGMLDLNTSKLQLVYGPYSNGGTSIVLLPVIASQQACPNDYCETAPVTITMPLTKIDVSGSNVSIPISGTIAGLTVGLTLKFYFSSSKQDSISVDVSATAKGASAIPLDPNPPNSSFKPVLLHAIFFSPDLWSAQQAFIAGQPHFSFPTPNLNQVDAQTFGLIGGTSSQVLVRNAPTIQVTMINPRSLLVTAEVQPSSDRSFNNVSLWGAFKKVQDTWSYTVTALYPYSTTP